MADLETELEEHKDAVRFLEMMIDAKSNPTNIYLVESLEWQERLVEFICTSLHLIMKRNGELMKSQAI